MQRWPKLLLVLFALYAASLLLASLFWTGERPVPDQLTLLGIRISLYGLVIAAALLIGYLAAAVLLTKDLPILDRVLLPLVIGGIIGARIGFILTSPLLSFDLASLLTIREGGLSLHGALAGGFLALLLVSWRRFNLIWLADRIVPFVALGQAFGRFGNFFNQEAFGLPTGLPWKMFIEPAFRPPGFEQVSFFHPLFLYEGFSNLLLFTLLSFLLVSRRFRPGQLFGLYLVLYSLLRFGLEFLRLETVSAGLLTLAQWASLGLAALGILLLLKASKMKG